MNEADNNSLFQTKRLLSYDIIFYLKENLVYIGLTIGQFIDVKIYRNVINRIFEYTKWK